MNLILDVTLCLVTTSFATFKLPDIGSEIGNLVSGPLDNIGFVPFDEALAKCENIARWKVEEEISRIQNSGQLEAAATSIGSDLESRCRGYVEYAGFQCVDKLNRQVADLEARGRFVLSSETEGCTREVTRLSTQEAEAEERRLTLLGQREEQSLRKGYEAQGRQVEAEVFADFDRRANEIMTRLRAEYENRGREEEQKIRTELELRGEVQMAEIELELRKRGEVEAQEILAEFEARGAELEKTITKEFEDRGAEVMKEVEKELTERGRKLQLEGEDTCTDMITMACEDVIVGSESDEFCEEFLFFTDTIDKKKRKKRFRPK